MTRLPLTEAERSPSKRDQILDAAETAFAVRGFRAATMAEIASQIGLTQQGVLHYFASKTHLLLAVLERRQDTDLDRFLSFEGSFLDAFVRLASDNAARPGIIRLFTTLSAEGVDTDNAGHAWWTDRYARIRALTAEALTRDQRAGVVAADVDVNVAAIQIIALMDGLQLQWLLAPQDVDMITPLASFLATLRAPPKPKRRA